MPLHDEREARVLAAAVGVVTTSTWTRDSVLARYSLAADRVLVAAPGADLADLAPGTATGGELLCVAAVTPGKGQDVLVAALSSIADLAWRCTLVGSLDRDPAFVDACRTSVAHGGIEGRVRFAGPLTGADLDAAYAAADLLVLASRTETYGMVVTEALARGLPAIATKVGGLPEALGHDGDGLRPGLLVAPDDPEALATALRSWLGDSDARRLLRRSALERRTTLAGWSGTSRRISRVLEDVAG
jgi:glycosyltransferase involved in cell wall biosynthesis